MIKWFPNPLPRNDATRRREIRQNRKPLDFGCAAPGPWTLDRPADTLRPLDYHPRPLDRPADGPGGPDPGLSAAAPLGPWTVGPTVQGLGPRRSVRWVSGPSAGRSR